jgi:hypothetical protein
MPSMTETQTSRRDVLTAMAAAGLSPATPNTSMAELHSRHLFTLSIDLRPILEMGATPAGVRRIVPVAGGEFRGERLRGRVLPEAGSDLLLVRADGAAQQDVRLLLQTHDDAVVLMTYRGVRHGTREVNERIARGEPVAKSDYYLRIAPFFETGAPSYAWLNLILAVGTGERRPNGVVYEVFEIL